MRSKKLIIIGILLVSLTTIILAYEFSGGDNIPKGWIKTGSDPESYEIGTEKGAGQNNSNAVYIKSVKTDIKGFGCLMQQFSAEKYLGKRVRLSGYMKSSDVIATAGFWMRIDGKEDPKQMLAFDNMNNRPVKGTTGWKLYQVVLDVPGNSGLINMGALIAGTGEIWFSNLKFEVVDKSVPTTDMFSSFKQIGEPVNLDFQE